MLLAEVGARPWDEDNKSEDEDANEQKASESEEDESEQESEDKDKSDQAEVADQKFEDSEQEPFVKESDVDGYTEDKDEEGQIEPEKLVLRDRREMVEVTVEDLDAAFEITFVELRWMRWQSSKTCLVCLSRTTCCGLLLARVAPRESWRALT